MFGLLGELSVDSSERLASKPVHIDISHLREGTSRYYQLSHATMT